MVAREGRALLALATLASLVSGCVVGSSPASQATASSVSVSPTAQASSGTATLASSPTADGIVPWLDDPAPAYVEPTPPPLPADARACRAADLRVASGDGGAGLGNTNIPVSFTNTSDSVCVLKGSATISGVKADGALVPLRIQSGSYFGDPGPIANIAPGEIAALNVSGGNACDAAQSGKQRIYPRLRIGLPSGDSVDVPSHGFDTVCGVSASAFGVPADTFPPIDVPMSPLTASINAPTTAVAGHDLAFTITLTNPTKTEVPLDLCPVYDEYVGSGEKVWVATALHYHLNCDPTTTIPADGSVTFEMHLAVPADQPAGMATFGWNVQGGGCPCAGFPLEVKAAGG